MSDPANRSTNAAGGKTYTHPVTGEQWDSVTTVLDVFDKGGLKIWSAQLAATQALELLPQLTASVLAPDCGNTYNRCYQKHGRENRCERCPCGGCERCMHRRLAWHHAKESSRRAQEGTECHHAINQWITQGGLQISLRGEVQPYFDSFLRWAQDYGLLPNGTDAGEGSWEQSEVTLINREHGYAGTSDGALWIFPRTDLARDFLMRLGLEQALIRVDYKTREKDEEKLYYDMPLQGIAYERCETVMLPDGTEHPAIATVVRCVLQLRPGGYTFVPMMSDEQAFQAFLGILTAYRWMTGVGKKPWGWGVEVVRSGLPVGPPVTVGEAETAVLDPVSLRQEVIDAFADPWADQPPWETDPAGEDYAAVQEAQAGVYTPPPPAKKATKAAKKTTQRKISATQNVDPFDLGRAPNPTLASMAPDHFGATLQPAEPVMALFDEPTPF